MVAPIESAPELRQINNETMLPDLLRAYPQARRVLDRYGLRGCGGRLGPVESIAFFSRTHGIDQTKLLDELRQAAARSQTVGEGALSPPSAADSIYRRFFLAAILLILTVGATWGALLLWQIGFAGKFVGASIHHINAHGHAQIFGWVGLFIMGFAYQAFPRIWHTELRSPRLAVLSFGLMIAGLVLRTAGMTLSGYWEFALPATIAGGCAEIIAVLIFAGLIYRTFQQSKAMIEPYIGFVMAALFWFVSMSIFDAWHTFTTMSAESRQQLLWYVATYQAPLRDLQIHGLALFMILGVSLRMLPALFGVPSPSHRRAWWALWILIAAVAGESALFVAYRWSGSHVYASLLLLPWLMLAGGCAMVALPWRLWGRLPISDRSGKFVRAAYAWLAVSLLLLLLLPLYQLISKIPFSHAYYGATRHAITVGFISMMIMGMAAKVVPTLNGRDPRGLSALWGPFLLVNLGCFLRVSTQTLTDWDARFFAVIGISGMLEVVGLAWWGTGLTLIMLQGQEASEEPTSASRPARIGPNHYVADVISWFPGTLEVFNRLGFTLISQPMMRRTVARGVTIAQAAAFRGVCEGEMLRSLNTAIGSNAPECTAGCKSSEAGATN